MPAPDSVIQLCETFAGHREHFRSGNYNEAQLRKQFLDPFFEALGWDMANSQGLAPQYRDVIHEDAIKIGPHVKAPDYAFTIHGQRKFFVEAKRPFVNIKTDIAPAYQLRRYAWSAKLPLSILTDFEEFAIYDTRIKPAPNDPSSKARIFYCTYDQFAEKWDEIASIFSRDAILKGSFDKYAESAKKKKGTAEVDTAFLEEIERWRDLLARNFALRNPSLTVRDLNFAVQKTIDRLVFLRICEDRGTEDYGRLRVVANGTQTYPRLLEVFRAADARYNSGLFHFSKEKSQAEEPDTLTPHLKLDDKILKDIIGHLYYPDSPYEFSVLPADILGSVYERFLGKTIRLTEGHQAKIEEKPEVRKAGGVYYTPAYIVEYIVENTLGKLLAPDGSKEPISIPAAAKLKVCDPACGSGSFLIVAYQFLLDWHRDRYCEDVTKWSKGKNATLYQAKGGEWRLTTAEKKRILLNNIHGVDIDAAAVEVTKLSLLLKVLEGETSQIGQRDFIKERERILPDLANNIKCGNSLIGPDFYDSPEMDLLDDDARYHVNVFDWKSGFPEVFKQGGFDCVIGNPPYVRSRHLADHEKKYYAKRFETALYQPDLFAFFVENGSKNLAPQGRLGFIIPSGILTNTQYEPLRRYLLTERPPDIVVDLKGLVFVDASVDTVILILGDAASKGESKRLIKIGEFPAAKCLNVETPSTELRISEIVGTPGCTFNTGASQRTINLASRMRSCSVSASEFFVVRAGMKVRKEFVATSKIDQRYQLFLRGGNIAPYSCDWRGAWVCYDKNLESRHTNQAFRDRSTFDVGDKLLVRQVMGKERIYATRDMMRFFVDQSLYVLLLKKRNESPSYLLGLICSRLLGSFFNTTSGDRKQTFPKIKGNQIAQLPIRPIDCSQVGDIEKHDRMVSLVDKMLALVPKRRTEANPQAAAQLDMQISATDRQIDRLVYELYGLTEDEIALVEGA